MNYITHHRYRELALCGKRLNIPYGTELREEGHRLYTPDGDEVCASGSENAKKHFAVNDDGRGLERGLLTYAIAYSAGRAAGGFRFDERQAETLVRGWSRYLRDDVDVILFNDAFFHAPVDELEELAKALKITVRR